MMLKWQAGNVMIVFCDNRLRAIIEMFAVNQFQHYFFRYKSLIDTMGDKFLKKKRKQDRCASEQSSSKSTDSGDLNTDKKRLRKDTGFLKPTE